MTAYHIATIPGDGIGKEVVAEAVRVLQHLGGMFDFEIAWTRYPWSCEYYLEQGRMMPADAIDQLRRHDAIFLGAVGFPGVADHVSLWGLLIPIRRAFQQYVNLRPVRSFHGVRGPLRADLAGGIDLVIVRENNEGEYSEIGGRLYRDTPAEVAVQEAIFTRNGVERIVTYAFGLARERKSQLTSATKSNGIIHTMVFWDQIVEEVGSRFPDVKRNKVHIDALAAQFVLVPSHLDVIVGSNLFGDILSDLAAAITGSIGVAPSANLNPERDYPSMFEPVHGSAPDIAGKGVANPVGQIWSGAMMLRHLGEVHAADALERAIASVLDRGDPLTPDLGGSASTKRVTNAVIDALSRSA